MLKLNTRPVKQTWIPPPLCANTTVHGHTYIPTNYKIFTKMLFPSVFFHFPSQEMNEWDKVAKKMLRKQI